MARDLADGLQRVLEQRATEAGLAPELALELLELPPDPHIHVPLREDGSTAVAAAACETKTPAAPAAPTTSHSPMFLPDRPYHLVVALRLMTWAANSAFPIEHPRLDHCTILDDEYRRVRSLTPAVVQAVTDCMVASNTTQGDRILIDLLRQLRPSGLLMLLGMQRTAGTLDRCPPARAQLRQAFDQPLSAKTKMSVGARALTKHFHRGQDRWWGDPLKKGNDDAKNAHARVMLERILQDVVWVNCHQILGQQPLLELRVKEGYGARWSADGKEFRGFVEPQQADGHTKGWTH